MKRSLVISLVVTASIAVIALAATLAAGWSPKLGLDLAGGSQVVYSGPNGSPIPKKDIATTISIMNNRVNALGVSGASVGSQGGDIVVQLPGLKNPQAVIQTIGTTAQLHFRPVLCGADPYSAPKTGTPPTTLPTSCSSAQYSLQAPTLTVDQSSQTSNANQIPPDPVLTNYPSTTHNYDDTHAGAYVLAPLQGGGGLRYLLGPSEVNGDAVHSAQALVPQGETQWVVDITLTPSGSAQWDAMTKKYFHEMIGIDLDGTVISAPLTQPGQAAWSSFNGQVEISGSFTQASATNLALALNYGSLPVPLDKVNQETVSPTLGKASLKAGLAAGIGGLILVLLYMIFYYRALGIVVISGLLLTAALLWAIVCAFGQARNLTLDLAGVTGIIVSIGITVDSYIVYFERLKDEARAGRSLRTTVDKTFRGAFRTVLAADAVSFAAALVLYLFAIGSVKGFAFFLGLSTLLDVFMTFFFTRPLVILLARTPAITDAPVIGIARGLAVEQGATA
ncbi:MAG TPA: protein translocase subunit SecD [Acidimicrobiales bacterium]|nr:protein translocase subunit SecD [Acidimicrobiales bacterium]